MKALFAIAILMTSIIACTSTKKTTPSAIGVVPLHNYVLNENTSFSDDTNFLFFGSANIFHNTFSMTKTSIRNAIVPDFAAQSVVAIIMKPTEKVVSVEINKATTSGKDLNIYYTTADTTSWQTYKQTPMTVATVPKSGSVRKVNFFKDNIRQKTIVATY
jgi:hypothetical protein